jgi:hypothetical protein
VKAAWEPITESAIAASLAIYAADLLSAGEELEGYLESCDKAYWACKSGYGRDDEQVVRANNMKVSNRAINGVLIAAILAAMLPIKTPLKIGIAITLPTFIKCLGHDLKALMIGGSLDFKGWSVEYLGVALPMLRDVAFKTFHGILLIPSVLLFAAWAYLKSESESSD